jgi:HEAT repeat protein
MNELEQLIQQLHYNADPEKRRNAAFVLGRQRDFRVIPPLVAATHDPDLLVRVRVLESLGSFKDPLVLPPLLEALRDTDRDVRVQAARSLANVCEGDEATIDALIVALDDPSDVVRSEVAETLGKVGNERAAEALVKLLDDPDATVRYFAAQSLAVLGGDYAVKALVTGLAKYADSAVMLIDILNTLAKIGDKRALNAVQSYIEHPDSDVQTTAQWAVGRLK